jgi:HB1, ASXL, restriction endonuclease HTH domain
MTSKPKLSAPLAAVEILKAEGGPLHIKVITERVLAQYETGLKGKTPQATLGAKLHVSAKKGETFRKVGPGTFELIPEGETPAPVAPAVDEAGETAEDDFDPRPPGSKATIVRHGKGTEAKPDPKPSSTKPKARTARVKATA